MEGLRIGASGQACGVFRIQGCGVEGLFQLLEFMLRVFWARDSASDSAFTGLWVVNTYMSMHAATPTCYSSGSFVFRVDYPCQRFICPWCKAAALFRAHFAGELLEAPAVDRGWRLWSFLF